MDTFFDVELQTSTFIFGYDILLLIRTNFLLVSQSVIILQLNSYFVLKSIDPIINL